MVTLNSVRLTIRINHHREAYVQTHENVHIPMYVSKGPYFMSLCVVSFYVPCKSGTRSEDVLQVKGGPRRGLLRLARPVYFQMQAPGQSLSFD